MKKPLCCGEVFCHLKNRVKYTVSHQTVHGYPSMKNPAFDAGVTFLPKKLGLDTTCVKLRASFSARKEKS